MLLTDLTPEQYSIYVGLLTEKQAIELKGQLYMDNSFFNPIQDNNDNWVISIEEMDQCVNPEFLWVKNLTLIIYEPKTPNFPISEEEIIS
jgi:hypothetical protein